MGLREVDFLLVPVFSPPGTHPALEGAQNAVTEALTVTPLQFFKQGSSLQTRFGFKQRHQLRCPHPGQWICPGSPVSRSAL